ncbi:MULTISPECIES: hypothetical protein [Streptomyces]|uniref:hypothetical protein n=1 Tax=Streptomyces TaxID=1883 RepID=UPI0013E3923D|nr:MULTISPECIES: hypothetical protein [Streptomyces]MDF3140157.1 hypothetical protein [Streptomyces sp. T21Q-yed]WDF41733.1 hypothetical protein PBV52_35530 [Streptomyces sp. T12]
MRSLIIASTAEIAGSFIISMSASNMACLSSSRRRRTIRRAAWVAPIPATEDRPKVKGAAAAAAAIWMARAMSWAITAHLANSTR